MKRIVPLFGGVIAIGVCLAILLFTSEEKQPARVVLPVPYASQSPDGVWEAPWDEACEETSAIMVGEYYQKVPSLSKDEVKQRILPIVDWEKKTFGEYRDTTAEETVQMIESLFSFDASVRRNPRIEDIQVELQKGRPVIALVDMYKLYQEPDLGDSYHVFVIIGYDTEAQHFIVHDPARLASTEYTYDQVMQALHDFNPVSKEADGTPTVLFTDG